MNLIFFYIVCLLGTVSSSFFSNATQLPSRENLTPEQREKIESIYENRFNLGSTDLDCSYIKICGFEVCSMVCEPGSLHIPDWLKQSMYSQIHLQDDTPLNWRAVLGTHNTFNALPYGYGLPQDYLDALMKTINPEWKVVIANQQVSITDQLNIGIRFLELDVHWLLNKLRLCHAGGLELERFDELIEYIENVTGKVIYYDSETMGCWNWSREFSDGLHEINNWLDLPENKYEFLFIYTNIQQDLLDWGKGPLMVGNYTEVFGDRIFTQADKDELFPGEKWPTVEELISMGKRIIICTADLGDQDPANVTFDSGTVWSETSQSGTTGYPNCSLEYYPPGPNQGFMTLVRDDALYYGPFWNGSDGGRLNATTIPPLSQCAFTFINPDELIPDTAYYIIWSWDADQPENQIDSIQYCTKIQGNSETGRWASGLCSEQHYFACIRDGDPTYDHRSDWKLSSSRAKWSEGEKLCPFGYTFEYPRNAWVNTVLIDLLRSSSVPNDDIWINVPYVPIAK